MEIGVRKRLRPGHLLVGLVTVVLLLLAWAALDDITTGSESSLVAEYIAVVVASVWLLGLSLTGFRRRR